jgi:creatinine amidohydrolase
MVLPVMDPWYYRKLFARLTELRDIRMDFSPRRALWDMTWPELEAAAREIDLVLIPTGSIVQHGPNSTFASDAVRAYQFSLMIAERLHPRILVAPVMPFGIAPQHMSFTGTISISGESYMNVLFDIVESLAEHGFDRFLFINAHSGNHGALDLLLSRIRNKLDLNSAWVSISTLAEDVIRTSAPGEETGHSDRSEVSQLLYLAPDTVRSGGLAAIEALEPEYPFSSPEGPIHTAYTVDEISANGVLGDPRLASREFGERIITTALDRVCTFIDSFTEGEGFYPPTTR